MRLLLVLLVTAVASAGETWPSLPGVTVRPDGGLVVGGVQLNPVHCDVRRRESHRRQPGQAVDSADQWSLQGDWSFPDGTTAPLIEVLRLVGSDAIEAAWRPSGTGAAGQIGFSCSLPGTSFRGRVMQVDGAVLPLLAESAQPDLFAGQVRALRLPLANGAELDLRGDLFLQVLDHRDWGEDRFAVRVFAPAGAATIRIRLVGAGVVGDTAVGSADPPVGEPLLLGEAAATPLCDAVAGDGIGGWTDQGGNDLACLPSGPLQAAGVGFSVGSTAALLSRTRVANRPERVAVAGKGRQAPCLYLLHTLAWAPRTEAVVGSVLTVFRDGSSDLQQVRSGVMVGDWWNPAERLPEAVLGWQGENGQARVGLFVSRLEIPDRPIERIELAVETETVWAVVGLALGPVSALRAAPPDVIAASARWLPTPVPFAVTAGSALDLSALSPAPLSGTVAIHDGHFFGADGRRLLVQGVNLCQEANFPSHAEADALVDAVRAMGCNALRFHHHDGGLVLPDGDGTALDPDKLDRLEYLIAACRRGGLFMTTDVYVSRVPPVGSIPEVTRKMRLKALIPLLPAAMDNWKRFASNWLTHRNPYTGTTLATDPGLLSISMVNEDNLGNWVKDDPEVAALYEQRFAACLAQQPGQAPTGAARAAAWSAWLARLQGEAYATMGAHLRSLGVTGPLTSLNWRQSWWSMAGRQGFDLVDNHSYHDHPRFPRQDWRLPIGLRQDSATASLLRATTEIATTRRFGQPFTVSEIQFCAPNVNRAEYAAAVPAVAGTQDWDGLWRFTLTGPVPGMFAEGPLASFGIAHDPIALLSERAVALLWRRGDIAPAAWSAGLVVDAQQAATSMEAGPVPAVADLALLARIGNLSPAEAVLAQQADPDLRCLLQHRAAGQAPAGRLPVVSADERLAASLAAAGLLGSDAWDAAKGLLQRGDGAVALDARSGQLRVAGRRGCAVVLPGGSEATVAGVSIINRDNDPATVVVAALDEGDLAQAKRLLVLHLTDAQNSGTRFASVRRTLLESWGRAPVLVRAGACSIRLPGSAPARAYALDLGGVRREAVAMPADRDGVTLDAQVARAWGPCLAWEVVR
jgi:hypothetical protein